MVKMMFLGLLFGSLAFAGAPQLEKRATYTAGATGIIPPATPTDICTLTGKAGKIIRVSRLSMSSTQTTAGINTFYVVKRQANATGTAVALTSVPMDSNTGASGSAGASAVYYTANPGTLGGLLGYIAVPNILTPAPASLADSAFDFDFNNNNGEFTQPVTLRGVNEVVALNFGGAALPTGLTINCSWVWTEE